MPHGGAALRVALLHQGGTGPPERARHVDELAATLRDAGHRVQVLGAHSGRCPRARRLVVALLRRRGFAAGLADVPFTVTALRGARFDVVHAFTASDTVSALAWRRLTGRRAVFTAVETLGRETLADARLRLWMVRRAVEESDAVLAGTVEAQRALARWLAVEAPLLAPGDAAGHERAYRGFAGAGRATARV
jgi:hypothetical protein